MILIITHKDDFHCNHVIKHFQKNGDEYFRLNTESLLTDYSFSFSQNDQSTNLLINNTTNGKILSSNEVKSVWERRPLPPVIPGLNKKKIKSVVEEEVAELVIWFRHFFINCRTIGSSVWDRPNESKLRQMDVASRVIKALNSEIKIPNTLLTNSKTDHNQFAKAVNKAVLKPIAADGIVLDDKFEIFFGSRQVASENLNNISEEDLKLCPIFMQEYIEKDYEIRITAIGQNILCCNIDSQKLPKGKGREDWREGYDYGLSEVEEWVDCPKEIEEFIILYLQKMNLNFGCFDFIKSKSGHYYFLECNPNGQWLWLEIDLGMPISESIANFLSFRDK
ncbi:MAG: hypothetical protein QF864_03925 [SAR202 cluster bacterium]|nr:hypothetical protein [SAR202 cluster bacterium]